MRQWAGELVGEEWICINCGLSHRDKRRQQALRRLLPMSKQDLQRAFPCWWGGEKFNDPGPRRLKWDLDQVGAKFTSHRHMPEYILPKGAL